MKPAEKLLLAYRMRWKRRRLLFRAWRKRRQISAAVNRTGAISADDILLFSCVRNEAARLPFFLKHYRSLGIGHFLFVDNDSNDGTAEYLADQADVSLWKTRASYRLARFGMDWLTWLMIRYGHDRWCLTVDADEILIYPNWKKRGLADLAAWLDGRGMRAFGAMMLDMYPEGALAEHPYVPGESPFDVLCWFDAQGYSTKYQPKLENLLIRGGVRERIFFQQEPERAPTLSKTPFVHWHRRYAYVSSTHSLLPPFLNHVRGPQAEDLPSGILLHSKFIDRVVERSRVEQQRNEHFENGALYRAYYQSLTQNPVLWCEQSCRYESWTQLEELGLMQRGEWK